MLLCSRLVPTLLDQNRNIASENCARPSGTRFPARASCPVRHHARAGSALQGKVNRGLAGKAVGAGFRASKAGRLCLGALIVAPRRRPCNLAVCQKRQILQRERLLQKGGLRHLVITTGQGIFRIA